MLRLAEAHWSYMDRFADRLILRGPTLSDDGTEHTGSIHVLNVTDLASAERFAAEEPFWLAGLYQRVNTIRTVVLLHREPNKGTLISGEWPPEPRSASDTGPQLLGVNPDGRLKFVAVLVDYNQSHTTGVISIITAPPGEALRIIRPFADQLTREPVAFTAQRWQRGGRD
jgi:uncharacterized protein YciI